MKNLDLVLLDRDKLDFNIEPEDPDMDGAPLVFDLLAPVVRSTTHPVVETRHSLGATSGRSPYPAFLGFYWRLARNHYDIILNAVREKKFPYGSKSFFCLNFLQENTHLSPEEMLSIARPFERMSAQMQRTSFLVTQQIKP